MRDINRFQADSARATGRYGEGSKSARLPVLMDPSFQVQLSTDGIHYLVSAKDSLDACGWAVFSDQEGVVYQGVPVP